VPRREKPSRLRVSSAPRRGRLEDLVDVVAGGAGQVVAQQLGDADDGGQHVVHVVGHPASQGADRLQLLRVQELLLQQLALVLVLAIALSQRLEVGEVAGRRLVGHDRDQPERAEGDRRQPEIAPVGGEADRHPQGEEQHGRPQQPGPEQVQARQQDLDRGQHGELDPPGQPEAERGQARPERPRHGRQARGPALRNPSPLHRGVDHQRVETPDDDAGVEDPRDVRVGQREVAGGEDGEADPAEAGDAEPFQRGRGQTLPQHDRIQRRWARHHLGWFGRSARPVRGVAAPYAPRTSALQSGPP
jgi:hypothetical protein